MESRVKLIKDFLWMLLMSAALFCCGKASAQVLPEYSAFPSSALGVDLSTQGLGVQGSYCFARVLNARVGFNNMFGFLQYENRDLSFDRNSFYARVGRS